MKIKLKKNLLEFKKGEILGYDNDWGIWTRQKTNKEYSTRGTIEEGETVLLLNSVSEMISVCEVLHE